MSMSLNELFQLCQQEVDLRSKYKYAYHAIYRNTKCEEYLELKGTFGQPYCSCTGEVVSQHCHRLYYSDMVQNTLCQGLTRHEAREVYTHGGKRGRMFKNINSKQHHLAVIMYICSKFQRSGFGKVNPHHHDCCVPGFIAKDDYSDYLRQICCMFDCEQELNDYIG